MSAATVVIVELVCAPDVFGFDVGGARPAFGKPSIAQLFVMRVMNWLDLGRR